MSFTRRDILDQVAATILTAATVLGFTATHEGWNVWLIGDSRRWTTALLTVLGLSTFALVARHVGSRALAALAIAAFVFAALAFWTASLTPLSLLAATIIIVWALAVLRDLLEVPRRPIRI